MVQSLCKLSDLIINKNMLQITLQIYVLACVFIDMLEVYLKYI